MTKGEVRLAQVGRERRPVLVLTLVSVAEIAPLIPGLAAEVDLDQEAAPLGQPSVINCDGLHTDARSSPATFVGDADTMRRVCGAVSNSLGC